MSIESERNERLTKILYEIDSGNGWVSITKDEMNNDPIWVKDIYFLEGKGLLNKLQSSSYRLSSDGQDIIHKDWTYTDWEQSKSIAINPYIHIGHNITGNISQSDLSVDDKSINKNITETNNNSDTKSKTGPWMLIAKIFGSIATILGIIYGVLKSMGIV